MREEKVLLPTGSPPETQTVLLEKFKVEQPVSSSLALLCLRPFVLPLLPQMAAHPIPHPLGKKGIRKLEPMNSLTSWYTQYQSQQGVGRGGVVLLHVLQIQVFVP